MALLDIEKIINEKHIGSRFKLVHLAGIRAKEINNPNEDTVLPNLKETQKVTTKALNDLITGKVVFHEVNSKVNNCNE